MDVKVKQNQSVAWKGILNVRSVMKKEVRWIVGNSRDIMFWTQNWVFPFPLQNLLPKDQLSQIDLGLRVSHFITDGS